VIGSYRNRPVRVDAIQWDGTRESEEEITHWALARVRGSASGRHLTIHTPTRNERALPGRLDRENIQRSVQYREG
jgi:hypothetical protein